MGDRRAGWVGMRFGVSYLLKFLHEAGESEAPCPSAPRVAVRRMPTLVSDTSQIMQHAGHP